MASSKPRTATRSGGTARQARNRGGDGAAAAARPASQNRQAPQTRKARDRAKARKLAEQRAAAAKPKVAAGPPLWLQVVSLVLAIGGLGVSIYMTYEHFTGNKTLACAANSVVNCGAVTTSPESMVFGVFPVAVLGLVFFVFAIPLLTPWAWRSDRREIALARLGSVIVGIGFVIYLIYVELIQVGYICLECTSVHVITFLLFVIVAMSAAVWGLPKHWGRLPKPRARTSR
jgi:uncharacterized membrane protein